MTGLITVLAFILNAPCLASCKPPNADLVVEVVDSGWLPVPGIAVIVTQEGTSRFLKEQTDACGHATFRVNRDKDVKYEVAAEGPGFTRAVMSHLSLGVQVPTPVAARVPVQVKVKH